MNMQISVAHVAANADPLPKVRLVCAADGPALVQMGRDLHDENGLMPFSVRKAQEMAARAINRQGVICGAIGPIGDPEAVICLMTGQYWYSEYPHLEELFAYVRPEFRRSNRAKALVEFAKKAAHDLDVPLLIGVVSQERTEAKIRLYRRQLGRPAGAYFLFNGRTGS